MELLDGTHSVPASVWNACEHERLLCADTESSSRASSSDTRRPSQNSYFWVVNLLQVMLSDLQREHREALSGEQRAWCMRLCVILRDENRKHGGKVSSRAVLSP